MEALERTEQFFDHVTHSEHLRVQRDMSACPSSPLLLRCWPSSSLYQHLSLDGQDLPPLPPLRPSSTTGHTRITNLSVIVASTHRLMQTAAPVQELIAVRKGLLLFIGYFSDVLLSPFAINICSLLYAAVINCSLGQNCSAHVRICLWQTNYLFPQPFSSG